MEVEKAGLAGKEYEISSHKVFGNPPRHDVSLLFEESYKHFDIPAFIPLKERILSVARPGEDTALLERTFLAEIKALGLFPAQVEIKSHRILGNGNHEFTLLVNGSYESFDFPVFLRPWLSL